MQVLVCENLKEIVSRTCQTILYCINSKSDAVLGLATGNTQLAIYQELVSLYQEGAIDFSKVRTFNLDEYQNLQNVDHSFHNYMWRNFFSKVNLNPANINLLPMDSNTNSKAIAADYENKIIAAGGIDLQILGIGRNGHIAFNEPGASFDSITREVELDQITREDAITEFSSLENVPKTAITMGIKTILSARKILLIALGDAKASPVKQMIEGEISESLPATALRLHPDVTVLLDGKAAKLIQNYTHSTGCE